LNGTHKIVFVLKGNVSVRKQSKAGSRQNEMTGVIIFAEFDHSMLPAPLKS